MVAAAVFLAVVGPRADIAAAAETVRFLFKFVVTGAARGNRAHAVVRAVAARSAPAATVSPALIAAPLALLAAVALELTAVPSQDWATRLVGSNMLDCLAFIPLMGVGPLALFILALRNAAPARPALAGAVAGLAAGGIAATLYAAHCTDNSPLFVATWYTLAIAMLTALGGLAGQDFRPLVILPG